MPSPAPHLHPGSTASALASALGLEPTDLLADPRAIESISAAGSRSLPLAMRPDERARLARDFAAAREGCPLAFRRIADTMAPRMQGTVRRVLRSDPSSRRDVVQETLFSAWQRLDRFRNVDHFVRWLHVVARNQAISVLRKSRSGRRLLGCTHDDGELAIDAQPRRHVDVAMLAARESPAPYSPSAVARLAAGDDLLLALSRCIDRLPEHQRAVVRLHHLEGLDPTQVAEALGVAHGTVKMRLWRARRRLAAALPLEVARMGPAAARDLTVFHEAFASRARTEGGPSDATSPT